MYNFYDRLKQKKDLVSLPTEVTDGYKEDMTETAEEINEDFIEALVDKIILETLPKQIEEKIKSSRSLEDLNKVTIQFSLENLGGIRYADRGKVYKYYTYPESFSFIDDDTHLIKGESLSIHFDDELRDLFEKQLIDRFSVYTQSNKEIQSGVSIKRFKDERASYREYISINGSVADFINIYYTELQGYNRRKKVKQKQEEYDDKKILDYDDEDFQNLGKVLKR